MNINIDEACKNHMPVLYFNDISPPVRFVLMTIKYINIEVKYIKIDLLSQQHRSDEYVKLNPFHTIPTLIHKDLILTDSHVICTYLINEFAPTSQLYPLDYRIRAKIDCVLYFNNGIFFPRESAIMQSPFHPRQKLHFKENVKLYQESLQFLEILCKKSKYLVGDCITLADLCCISTLSSTELLTPFDKQCFPNIDKWLKLCEKEYVVQTANKPGIDNLKKFFDDFGNFSHITETIIIKSE